MTSASEFLSLRSRTLEWHPTKGKKNAYTLYRAGSVAGRLTLAENETATYLAESLEGAWLIKVDGVFQGRLEVTAAESKESVATFHLTDRLTGKWSFKTGDGFLLVNDSKLLEKVHVCCESDQLLFSYLSVDLSLKSLLTRSAQVQVQQDALDSPALAPLIFSTWVVILIAGITYG